MVKISRINTHGVMENAWFTWSTSTWVMRKGTTHEKFTTGRCTEIQLDYIGALIVHGTHALAGVPSLTSWPLQ